MCSCPALLFRWLSRPDSVVDESEEVPLGTRFGLEVPEDPAVGVLLERVDLSLDVVSCGVLEILVPLIDEVLRRAATDVGRAVAIGLRVGPVVAGADAIAVLQKRVSKRGKDKTSQAGGLPKQLRSRSWQLSIHHR